MARAVDLTGKTFGKLTALYPIEGRNVSGMVIWKFLCSCGKYSFHAGYRVKSGQINSCGCSRKKSDKHNTIRAQFDTYRYNAKRRGIAFFLGFYEFENLVQQKCHYCGEPPVKSFKKHEFNVNGIDRKNSNDHYTTVNSVPCCTQCNMAKRELSEKSFVEWIKKVHNHIMGESK